MRQLQSSSHEQWGCAFCGAACCTQTSQMVATAMLALEDGGSGASGACMFLWLHMPQPCALNLSPPGDPSKPL